MMSKQFGKALLSSWPAYRTEAGARDSNTWAPQ